MNNTLLKWIVPCVMFVACANQEEPIKNEVVETSINVNKRTLAEAVSIAESAVSMFDDAETRSVVRKVSLPDTKYIVGKTATRSSEPDTLMYVLNYEDNRGFAVVSANRNTEELIAVSDQGNYNEELENEIPALNTYMDMAEEYVTTGGLITDPYIDETPLPLTQHKIETVRTTLASYGPFVEVRWGQYSPYNLECPSRYPVGCAATAVAQILSYIERPTNIYVTYEEPYYMQEIDWDLLKTHSNNDNSNLVDSCETSTHQLMAVVFRQIGYGMKMVYSSGGSATTLKDIISFVDGWGFNHIHYTSFDQSTVIKRLSENIALYIQGTCVDDTDGHAWVLDGYKKVESVTCEYSRPQHQLEWDLLTRSVTVSEYNHFNWGASGDGNGYYLSGVFDTSKPYELDEEVDKAASDAFENIQLLAIY